jgi:hypothetical protein
VGILERLAKDAPVREHARQSLHGPPDDSGDRGGSEVR